MSVHNQNIITRILDPVFDRSNFKTEYRLNGDTVYLSNMRITGMGYKKTAGGTSALNPLLGAFCMQSIQLYDGNQLLDQVLEASIWRAWKMFNNKNDELCSLEGIVSRSDYGFVATGDDSWTGANPDRDGIQIEYCNQLQNFSSGESAELSQSWFSLKGFLPFLSASLYVPTNVYKNLRLVINWKSPQQLKEIGADVTDDYETLDECALVVDEVLDGDAKMSMMQSYQGLAWRAVEHDGVTCPQLSPASGQTQQQNNRFLVNGFNNKTLGKLLVVKTPLDAGAYRSGNVNQGVGSQGSIACVDDEFQFRVNGANKLPRTGYTKTNQRLASLTDSYGDCCLPSGGNYSYVPLMTAVSDATSTAQLQGQLDYTCVEVQEAVRELVVEYNRLGVHGNADFNTTLRLNMFAEVHKAITMTKDGRYIVSYI
jgi:hypothetical protein